MEKLGRATMVSVGTVITAVIPVTIAWSKLESRIEQVEKAKVEKLELAETMSDMKVQLQRIESNQESLSRDVKRALKGK